MKPAFRQSPILGIFAAAFFQCLEIAAAAVETPEQGQYFAKKAYEPSPLPTFENTKALLPSPIYDANPGYVAMYWKTWELAFRNFHEPKPGSGFVSQYIDAAFNQCTFQWDSCFMSMFCNTAYPLVPGISSLDNFYAKQHADGEICRELIRDTGKDYKNDINTKGEPFYSTWGYHVGTSGPKKAPIAYRGRPAPAKPSKLTLDAMNHPLFAWAEMEFYRTTGDKTRLALVYPSLVKYYEALREYLRQGNGLYMTDWASMDNAPRNPYLAGGGCGVDISCEMAFFARDMAQMAGLVGHGEDATRFEKDAKELDEIINRLMWDPKRNFYFDLTAKDTRAPVKSAAGFWALIAGVASKEQAAALSAELENPKTFNRLHPVPTLSADEPGYSPLGDYWCGASWSPTTTMVIRGLEKYGYAEQARNIALKDLDVVWQVFEKTGTVWENYAPDFVAPGKRHGGKLVVRDLVGWTGLQPILFLLEYGVGLKPDAPANTLTWDIRSDKRVGCERYRFGGHVVDLLATPAAGGWTLSVKSDGAFRLVVKTGGKEQAFDIRQGEQKLIGNSL